MIAAEVAGTHAYANVTVKGHAKRRQRELRKLGHQPATSTGEADVSGWEQLAGAFEQMGVPVVRGGERLVN